MELRLLLSLLWRRRRLLALVFVGVFVPLFLMTVLVETQYVSSAKIYLYKSPTKNALLSRLNLEASSPMPSDGLSDQEKETFQALAMTRPVIDPIIEKLHLRRKRKSLQLVELIPLVRPLIRALAPDFGRRALPYEEFTHKSVVHVIFPRPYLSVDMVEDSDILEFSSSADSMELAVAVANAAAKSFMEFEKTTRQKDCSAVAAALERELPKAKAAFQAVQADLGKVREDKKVIDIEAESERLAERYQTTLAERDQSRLNRIKTQGQLDSLREQLSRTPEFRKASEQYQRSSLLDSVKLTLRDLYLDLANTKTRYTAEHPAVKDIENKIAEAKKILDSETQKIFGSETRSTDPVHIYLAERLADAAALATAYAAQEEAYVVVVEALEREIAAFSRKSEAASLPAVKAEAAQTYLEDLLVLHAQALAGNSVDLGISLLVEPAVIPGKIDDYMRPKLSLFAAAALFLAAFFAFLTAVTAEYLDDSPRGPDDAARAGVAYLGAVPAGPPPARREALRLLRQTLAGPGPDRAAGAVSASPADAANPTAPAGSSGPTPPALVLAGVEDDRGLPELAAGLAEAMARSGRSVLLAEADWRAPRLAARLDVAPVPGLRDVLEGQADLAAATHALPESGLSFVPAGLATEDADLLAESPALGAFLAEAAGRHDRVLLTAPPVLFSGDAASLGGRVGGVVLVAGWGRTDTRDLAEAARRLRAAGAVVFGVALDGAPADRPGRESRQAAREALGRLKRWRRDKKKGR